MDAFDNLSPALHYTPTRKELPRVVRGLPLEDKIFRLTLRNLRTHPVLPVFFSSAPFLALGPHGVSVEEHPHLLPDGREQWRSLDPLGPRETRDYFVYLDTQSEQFPPPGTRLFQITLELFVEEQGLFTPAGDIPIVIRDVLATIPDWDGIVALDFGTTNTCAVISPRDQWHPKVVVLTQGAVGDGEEVPSLIAYHDVSDPDVPQYAVGKEAKLLLGQPGGDEVISSVKRYVAARTQFLVGSARDATPVYYRAGDVAAHIVSTVRSRVERFLGQQAVVQLTCTYPTAYHKAQITELESVFRDVQKDVIERYREDIRPVDMLLDEATAAAIFYLHHRFGSLEELRAHISGKEFSVLCYDLGGGTTDLSLTRFAFDKGTNPNPFDAVIEPIEEDPHLVDLSTALTPTGGVVGEQTRMRTVVHGTISQRDGIDSFGGDNMTLSVFRVLKLRYALLLGDLILSGDMDSFSLDDVGALHGAAEMVTGQRKVLERWARRGDPAAADTGVGYEGHAGIIVPDHLWDAIDVLVPTRFHESYDFAGPQRDARHDTFYDLWQTADTAKIDFGTADARGDYPSVTEPIPPATLLDRYQIGPARLAARITASELRAHIEPPLMMGFAKAKAMLREENLLSADFFVLAGNACKLPLIRELFTTQLSSFGAVEGWNVLFDPAVAKTAVARGAALYAVEAARPDGGTWSLVEEKDVLREHIGVLESQSVFASAAEPLHRWFERGAPVPLQARVRLRKDMPSLRVYATRRIGSAPRLLGIFMFLRETGRVSWERLEPDLEEAIQELGLMQGGSVREDGTYIADVVLTRRHRLFLQRERTWYALWPVRLNLPDHLNPFSGKQ